MTQPDTTPPISGHRDPEGSSPWVMQLVVRVEKQSPPSRTAAAQAAAVATVTLLNDPRCAPGGDWRPAVERWNAGRIRKHCRRARGAAWDRVQELPGVTIDIGGTQVRAFVPCAMDDIATPIAKLQMSGTELDSSQDVTVVDPVPYGPVVVALCPQPHLGFGKAAAAAAHAAQLAAAQMPDARLEVWRTAGFPVVVEHPDPARWADLLAASPVRIVDAGLTEVEPGTTTATARWS